MSSNKKPFKASGPQKRKGGPSLNDRLEQHAHSAGDFESESNHNPKKQRNHKSMTKANEARTFTTPAKGARRAVWADSDDENIVHVNKHGRAVIQNEVSLRDKNSKKRLRLRADQKAMGQGDFAESLRKNFEATFETPEWAKARRDVPNVAQAAPFIDSSDSESEDSESDEPVKSEFDTRTKDEQRDEDEDSEDDGENIKKESIKKEKKEKKDKKTETKKENTGLKQVSESQDGSKVYELQYQSDDALRDEQEQDTVRTLQQIEDLFAGSKSLKAKIGDGLAGTLTNGSLPHKHLFINRLPDANQAQPTKSLLTTVSWHNNNELLFTAGMDKTLRLFQMDGVTNPCIMSLMFELMPVYKAGFINNQSEILVTGRRKFMQVVNLHTSQVTKIQEIKGREEKSWEYWVPSNNSTMIAMIGDNSTIVVISAVTKQFICEIRCKAGLNDLTWSSDDQYLFTTGRDGMIYCYHVGQRSQVFSFRDVGVHQGTTLSMSGGGKYLATGSTNGVVNVYDTNFENLLKAESDPLADSFASYYGSYTSYEENIKLSVAEITNLTTKVDYLKWSPSNEILAIGSRHKKDAIKLVHVPTFTAFPNWPTPQTPFSYVQDIAWSADNTKLAFANDKGRVLLYKLAHYKKHCNL